MACASTLRSSRLRELGWMTIVKLASLVPGGTAAEEWGGEIVSE